MSISNQILSYNTAKFDVMLTTQYIVSDVILFPNNGVVMPRNSLLTVLLMTNIANLKFSNQKNERIDPKKCIQLTEQCAMCMHCLTLYTIN